MTTKQKVRKPNYPQCQKCGANHAHPEPKCTKYNGWTNYETWHTKLAIDNDGGSYRYWVDAVKEIRESADENPERDYPGQEYRDYVVGRIARRLKDEIEEGLPEIEDPMYSALLRAGFDEIDWFEIANSMFEDELSA